MRRSLEFTFLSIVALTALGIGAVNAPPALRTLFPVTLAYAAIGGVLLSVIAGVSGLTRGRILTVLSAVLLLAGLVGITLGRWRVQTGEWREERRKQLTEAAGAEATRAALARQTVEASKPDDSADPELKARYNELLRGLAVEAIDERLARETSLWTWLNNRTLKHGSWEPPWPALFTLTELILSAAGGTWIAHWMARPAASAASGPEPTGLP